MSAAPESRAPAAGAQCWTLPLELVTPAFIGGSEPNDRAELRVPSIIGALRAWYRLLLGPEAAAGLPGWLDEASTDVERAQRLALTEARVFGGTGPGDGQGRVLLSLVDGTVIGEMPWDNRALRNRLPGLAYLGFSLDMGQNKKKALRPGTAFRLRLIFPRGVRADTDAAVLGATWLWAWLGGLGTRARRGFGSTSLTGPVSFRDLLGAEASGPGLELPDLSKASNVPAFAKGLATGLWAIDDKVKAFRSGPTEGTAPCYRFDKKSRIVVWGGPTGQGWMYADDALDEVGQVFAEFRKQRGIDQLPMGALAMLERRERLPHAPHRTAFGLPLAYRKVGGGGGTPHVLQPMVVVPGSKDDKQPRLSESGRMPSPLIISIARCAGGHYAVFTLLSGQWPGRDIDVYERGAGRGYIQKDPNIKLPDVFLSTLAGRKEVRL